jgi:hypothetical protein
MNDGYSVLDVVEKDGGPAEVSDEVLAGLKEMITDLRTECTEYITERRQDAENTRYCHWEGQSTDGRKRKEALGRDPLPFEGASDNRIRLSDKLVRIFERQVVAAATRSESMVTGTEMTDASFAGKLTTLLRYVLKNVWGQDYRRQNKLSANYLYGDSPGAAIAYVDWVYEEALEYRTLRADEALAAIVQGAMEQAQSDDPAIFEQIMVQANMMFADPGQVSMLADALGAILPDVPPARLKKVAKDLQANMEAQYPARYVRRNEPCYKALRLYEDVFIPTNTTDIQRARCVVLREWYSKPEILERAAVEGWSDSFVSQLLYGDSTSKEGCGAEGQSAFDDYTVSGPERNTYNTTDNRDGLYEILRAYTRAANEDGVLGIYVYTLSHFVEEAAMERQLWDRKHGEYPFVFTAAESLTSRLLDSRGVPEVSMTDQAGMKLLRDSFEDHTQVSVNPPVIKPRGRPFFNVNRAPFGQIDADARDQIKFLEMTQYPQAADKMAREMRREVNEYWGLFDAETMPNEWLATLFAQDRVDDFLAYLSQIHAMTIQLCQQYMPDEVLQRIIGGNGVAIARTVEEIQGRFDYALVFDVQNLELEKIVQKADVVLKNIRPLDTKGVIPYTPFLKQIVAAIDPNWAELIPPEDVAEQRIVSEEQDNVVKMLNGIEPPMPETIEAPGMRLQVIQQTLAPRMQNPAAFPPIGPAAQMILQNRMKYLEFQNTQMANADIGRVGTEPVSEQQLVEAGQEERI